MRIALIDPNTSDGMTALMAGAARSRASPGTEVVALTSRPGPASIEGHYGEAVAAVGLLETIRATGDVHDAYVIACFGDPGLLAVRELVLGCAGMADLADAIGVPVIDGVTAAVRMADALVGLGKRGDLAPPLPQRYAGSLAHLQP